jgi:transposase
MLTLEQAVLAYREEYLVERGFGRVISKPLMLSPMYVQSNQRATGLIHLLSMALRILTILEGRCRQRLVQVQETCCVWKFPYDVSITTGIMG